MTWWPGSMFEPDMSHIVTMTYLHVISPLLSGSKSLLCVLTNLQLTAVWKVFFVFLGGFDCSNIWKSFWVRARRACVWMLSTALKINCTLRLHSDSQSKRTLCPDTVHGSSRQAQRYLELWVEGEEEGLSGAVEAVADFKGFWGQSTKHLQADRNAAG